MKGICFKSENFYACSNFAYILKRDKSVAKRLKSVPFNSVSDSMDSRHKRSMVDFKNSASESSNGLQAMRLTTRSCKLLQSKYM